MKNRMLALFAAMVLVSGSSVAQEKSQSTPASAKILIVFGKVSNDARSLLTDLDSEWKVANASALKGYEDHVVRVRCYIDAEKNQLHVLSIRKENGGETYSARYADSAFRR